MSLNPTLNDIIDAIVVNNIKRYKDHLVQLDVMLQKLSFNDSCHIFGCKKIGDTFNINKRIINERVKKSCRRLKSQGKIQIGTDNKQKIYLQCC